MRRTHRLLAAAILALSSCSRGEERREPVAEARAPELVHDGAMARVVLPRVASGAFEVTAHRSHMSLSARLVGATDAPAEDGGDRVVYRRALGGADVSHRLRADGTEDFIGFEQAPAEPAVRYEVALGESVAGLRLVARTLELLDATGAPRLRMAPPYLADAAGAHHDALVEVEGCAVDASPAPPWGRAPVPPGAARCTVAIRWGEVAYPAVLDPAWTTTDNMATARYLPAATVLSYMAVLVSGGAGSGGAGLLASAEIFEPTTGTWAATDDLVAARSAHQTVTLPDGRALAIGGLVDESGINCHTSAEIWSPVDGMWSLTDSLTTGRGYFTATLLPDGRVLAAGGYGGAALASAEIYDPMTSTWSDTGAMVTVRAQHTATLLLDGRVLAAGGLDFASSFEDTAELFDPAAGTWAPADAMTTAHAIHTATRLTDGRVLVAGGYDTDPIAAAEIYDPIADAWTATASLPAARGGHTATLLPDGRVLVAAGRGTASALLPSSLLFTPGSGWTTSASLNTPRDGHAAAALPDGRLLLAGGQSTIRLDSVEVFGRGIKLNEIRLDQPGTDNDEYIELTGPPGTSLTGLALVVLGDGAVSTGGDVEAVIDLTGGAIAADGTFVVATSAFTLGTEDLTAAFGLEDADNVTVVLAESFSGALDQDLDADDDCALDTLPWTFVYDMVAVIHDPGGDCAYGPTRVGPDGAVAPAHVFRCRDTDGRWVIGDPDPLAGTDTPSADNAPCALFGSCASADECASGFCVDGVCCVTSCGGGSPDDCMACNLPGSEGACALLPIATMCRDAAGVCDVFELCTGTDAACPADAFAPSQTICRGSIDTCDPVETCDGISATCPADVLASDGTPCADGLERHGQCENGTCTPAGEGGSGAEGGGGSSPEQPPPAPAEDCGCHLGTRGATPTSPLWLLALTCAACFRARATRRCRRGAPQNRGWSPPG